MGVHQRIDRVARRQLRPLLPDHVDFPSSKHILRFEGVNGPDAIKRKSPAKDEPWHYLDPTDESDTELYAMIKDHQANLTKALQENNTERAAFEAAWMSHAIVDGLTPAHHYPLEEKLTELRGEGIETRTTYKDKILLPGESKRQKLRNNWEFWGAKGVMTTHVLFEFGVATTMLRMKTIHSVPLEKDLIKLKNTGFIPVLKESIDHIYDLNMYETFQKKGWTPRLARQTREILIPRITKMVILAWYECAVKAAEKK
jgi:hypothetical protein